jgi:hypothetical protein
MKRRSETRSLKEIIKRVPQPLSSHLTHVSSLAPRKKRPMDPCYGQRPPPPPAFALCMDVLRYTARIYYISILFVGVSGPGLRAGYQNAVSPSQELTS